MRLIMKMMKKLKRKNQMEKQQNQQLKKLNLKKKKSMTSLKKLKSSSMRIFLRCQNKRSQNMLLKEEIKNNHMKRLSNLHLLLLRLQKSIIITTRRPSRQSLRRTRSQLPQFQKLLTKNSLARLCKRWWATQNSLRRPKTATKRRRQKRARKQKTKPSKIKPKPSPQLPLTSPQRTMMTQKPSKLNLTCVWAARKRLLRKRKKPSQP